MKTAEKESIAKRMAGHGQRLYYVARPHEDELRIRVYTIVAGKITGLDQLLNNEELEQMGLVRNRLCGRLNGPSGLVLPISGMPGYQTAYAVVRRVGRYLGLDVEPTSL